MDGTVLTVSGNTVSGTFTSVGQPIVRLVETLAGASGSPRTTDTRLAVAVPPAASVALRDELANGLQDQLGNRLVGQDASGPAKIRDAAASRGFLFGITYKPEDTSLSNAFRAALLSEAALLVPEFAAQATVWCPARGTFDFTRLDQNVAVAKSNGVPWRAPSAVIYFAHDMSWVSTNSNNVISPVNDSTGQPAVRADTWQAIVDELVTAYVARLASYNYPPISINVINETIDPTVSGGWRRNPWYNATPGAAPASYVYMFTKLRSALDAAGLTQVKLFMCQDQLEQPVNGFGTNLQNAFVTALGNLLNAGAPIDGVDDQCHLSLASGRDWAKYRSLLTSIVGLTNPATGLNLTVTLGEIDAKTGNTGIYTPSGYTPAELDRQMALIISELLDTALPFVTGGQVILWTFSDAFQGWGKGERPGMFDSNLVAKPAYYAAFREAFLWR